MGRESATSGRPRNPFPSSIDHVAGRTFTVRELDATFQRSAGRSNTQRRGQGAFASFNYVAVPADSERARHVLANTQAKDAMREAIAAVDRWRASRTREHRLAAIEALRAVDD